MLKTFVSSVSSQCTVSLYAEWELAHGAGGQWVNLLYFQFKLLVNSFKTYGGPKGPCIRTFYFLHFPKIKG